MAANSALRRSTFSLILVTIGVAGCNSWTPTMTAPAPKKMRPPVAAAAPSSGPAGRLGSDWPRFLGPTGDSVSTEKGILTSWPKDGLRLIWQADLGEGYCPPAVAGDRVY